MVRHAVRRRPLMAPAVLRELGPVANGKQGLIRIRKGASEFNEARVRAQAVRRVTPGYEERVELIRLGELDTERGLCLLLPVDALQLVAGLGPHDDHLVPGLTEGPVGNAEFRILEIAAQRAGNAHRKSSCCRSALSTARWRPPGEVEPPPSDGPPQIASGRVMRFAADHQ